MTIEGQRSEAPSHEENLFYDVRCFNCPNISEEDGDYLPGPSELAGIHEHITYGRALEIAQEHERKYGNTHIIVIREFDTGKIQDALDS